MDIPEDATSQFIGALFFLGVHEMLDTVPAVALMQNLATHQTSDVMAGTLGGTMVVAANRYRQLKGTQGEDIFVQEHWPDWCERNDDEHLYLRSLQFMNASLNNDPQGALFVWRAVVTADSSVQDDTAFIYRLLEDGQEIISRFMQGTDDEELFYCDDEDDDDEDDDDDF